MQRFLPVIERLNAAASPAELAEYYRAVEAGADLEALELAGRLTGRLPLLTRKVQAMVALAETLPENQPLLRQPALQLCGRRGGHGLGCGPHGAPGGQGAVAAAGRAAWLR